MSTTYTWIGAAGVHGAGSNAANWSPTGVPGDDDTVIIDDGGIVDLAQSGMNNNIFLDQGTMNFSGDNTITAANPSVAQGSTLTTASGPGVLGSSINTGVIDANGNFDNWGQIIAGGATRSTLTLNIDTLTNGGVTAPGYLYNYNTLEAQSGDTLNINIGDDSALLNSADVIANGGTVNINVASGAIAGGVAPVEGFFLIGGGGKIATNAGYSPSTVGVAPIYAFIDATTGNTLKIGNLANFGGRILGFGADDTIDLGTTIAATQVSYDDSTGILELENSSGTAIASLRLIGENYSNASFTLGTGSDGNTVLTDNTVITNEASSGTWQTAGLWSTSSVPSLADSPLIGLGATSAFTLTTGVSPVSANGFTVASSDATVQITSATNMTEGVDAYSGKVEVTSGKTLTAASVDIAGTGTLTIDASASLDLTGRPAVNLANSDDLLSLNGSSAPLAARVAGAGVINVNGSLLAGSNNVFVETGGTLNFGSSGSLVGNVYLRGGTITGTMKMSGNDDTLYVTSPQLGQDATAAGQTAPPFADTINGNLVATGSDDSIIFEIPTTTGQPNAQTYIYGPTYGFSGFNTVTVENGDTLQLQGTNSASTIVIDSGSTLQIGQNGTIGSYSGKVDVKSGANFVIDHSNGYTAGNLIVGSGSVVQMGSGSTYLTNTGNTFGGGVVIQQGTLKLAGAGTAGSGAIDFAGAGVMLKFVTTSLVSNTLTGFVQGDHIDLAAVSYNGGQPTLNLSDDVLSVTENGTTYQLHFDSSVAGQTFVAGTDGASGTIITLQAACYATGTRIATTRGEVAIEDLGVGDLALTASGEARPIIWLGWRSLKVSSHPRPETVRPIRVAAGAFGDGLPKRDLTLSPGHNIVVDGVLMPISALVNGISVAVLDVDEVEYRHLEFETHDIVLAEGLPAESYLDCGNRAAFVNGDAFIEAHPDFLPKLWRETCLPLVKEGPLVAAARARVISRLEAEGFAWSDDADFRLEADGRRVEALRLAPARFAFVVPEGTTEIALRSRVFVPAYATSESHDLRALGVRVSRLQVDGAEWPLDRTDFGLAGWREAEVESGRFAGRWTTGDARLPAGRLVVVDLAATGRYLLETRVCARDLGESAGSSFLVAGADEAVAWSVHTGARATPSRIVCDREPLGVLSAQDDVETFVEQGYRLLLGRAADAGGRRAHLGALARGELSRSDMIRELLGCAEARRRGAALAVFATEAEARMADRAA